MSFANTAFICVQENFPDVPDRVACPKNEEGRTGADTQPDTNETDRRSQDRQTQTRQTDADRSQTDDDVTRTRRTSKDTDETITEQRRSQFADVEVESTNN